MLHGFARADAATTPLARSTLYAGAAMEIVSPILLISDLGRPERFLNMLRVFKVTSPMSVGSWILVASSGSGDRAAALEPIGILRPLKRLAELGWFATGPPLATYTGALLANTAIPVWSEARDELPFVFGCERVRERRRDRRDLHAARVGGSGPPRRGRSARRSSSAWSHAMEKRLGFVGEVYRQGEAGKYAKLSKGLVAAGAGLLALARPAQPCRGRRRRRARARGRAGAPLVDLQSGLPVRPRPEVHRAPAKGTAATAEPRLTSTPHRYSACVTGTSCGYARTVTPAAVRQSRGFGRAADDARAVWGDQ